MPLVCFPAPPPSREPAKSPKPPSSPRPPSIPPIPPDAPAPPPRSVPSRPPPPFVEPPLPVAAKIIGNSATKPPIPLALAPFFPPSRTDRRSPDVLAADRERVDVVLVAVFFAVAFLLVAFFVFVPAPPPRRLSNTLPPALDPNAFLAIKFPRIFTASMDCKSRPGIDRMRVDFYIIEKENSRNLRGSRIKPWLSGRGSRWKRGNSSPRPRSGKAK